MIMAYIIVAVPEKKIFILLNFFFPLICYYSVNIEIILGSKMKIK
jgi:hypothetical protein